MQLVSYEVIDVPHKHALYDNMDGVADMVRWFVRGRVDRYTVAIEVVCETMRDEVHTALWRN